MILEAWILKAKTKYIFNLSGNMGRCLIFSPCKQKKYSHIFRDLKDKNKIYIHKSNRINSSPQKRHHNE